MYQARERLVGSFVVMLVWEVAYSLLCELTGTLVLAVAEEFDNTALVWCESIIEKVSHHSIFAPTQKTQLEVPGLRKDKNIPRNLLNNLSDESGTLAQMTLGSANSWFADSGLGFLYSRENDVLARWVHLHHEKRRSSKR